MSTIASILRGRNRNPKRISSFSFSRKLGFKLRPISAQRSTALPGGQVHFHMGAVSLVGGTMPTRDRQQAHTLQQQGRGCEELGPFLREGSS